MDGRKNFHKDLSEFFNNLNQDINQTIDLGVGGVINGTENTVEEIGEKIEHQYRVFGLIFLTTILIGTVGYLVGKSEFKRANNQPHITNIVTPSNTGELNQKSQVINSQKEQIISNWETAQKRAMEAVVITHNPPHTIEVWQKSQAKWQDHSQRCVYRCTS